MATTKIAFERLDRTTVTNLLNQVGVYVIWDSRATDRPTYIGEGEILKRLVEHARAFENPLNGYFATVSEIDGCDAKEMGEMIEALLLDVSVRIGQEPHRNRQSGSRRVFERFFQRFRKLTVLLEGFDPFINPEEARKRPSATFEVVLEKREGNWFIVHPWHDTDEWVNQHRKFKQ